MKTATTPATLLDEPQTGGKELQTVNDDAAAMFERLARDPNASVEKIERLMALWERGEAKKAEAAFNAAMSEAQGKMRPIAADASNPQTHSRYASYAALDRALRPIYTEYGFGLSFDTGEAPGADVVRVLCYVTHVAGHSRTYRADMPADGKGAKGGDVMTKTHAVGSAMSYGMRYLLKMVWNVAVGEDDDDGNAAGDTSEKPDAPVGFEQWGLELEAAAANGTAALMKAFNSGAEPLRLHLVKQHKASWESLKVRAAEVTKKGGRP